MVFVLSAFKNSIRPCLGIGSKTYFCLVWDRYIIGVETDIKLLQDWYYIRSRWCTGLRLVWTSVARTPAPYQVSITWGNTSHVPIPNRCKLAHASMYYWNKIGNILIRGASLYTKPTPVWSSLFFCTHQPQHKHWDAIVFSPPIFGGETRENLHSKSSKRKVQNSNEGLKSQKGRMSSCQLCMCRVVRCRLSGLLWISVSSYVRSISIL
jgi:hypothetical protein